ncbi:hypothetical protein DIPPA_11510 [Diplonema papillatum]|nr:hypothetical protein DIPPA_11510 [Diplonema papillatum]
MRAVSAMAGHLLFLLLAAGAAAECPLFDQWNVAATKYQLRNLGMTGAQVGDPLHKPSLALADDHSYANVTMGEGTITGDPNLVHPMTSSDDINVLHYVMLLWVKDQDMNTIAMAEFTPPYEGTPLLRVTIPKSVTSISAFGLCNQHGMYAGDQASVIPPADAPINDCAFQCMASANTPECLTPVNIKTQALLEQHRTHKDKDVIYEKNLVIKQTPESRPTASVLLLDQTDATNGNQFASSVYVELTMARHPEPIVVAAGTLSPLRDDDTLMFFAIPDVWDTDEYVLTPFISHSATGLHVGENLTISVTQDFCPLQASGCPGPTLQEASTECYMNIRLYNALGYRQSAHNAGSPDPFIPDTSVFSVEHTPVITGNGAYKVRVPTHPSSYIPGVEMHYITTIAVVDESGLVIAMAEFGPFEKDPTLEFDLLDKTGSKRTVIAYAFCNLHGLFRSEPMELASFTLPETYECRFQSCVQLGEETNKYPNCTIEEYHREKALERHKMITGLDEPWPLGTDNSKVPIITFLGATEARVSVAQMTRAGTGPESIDYIELIYVVGSLGDVIASWEIFPGVGGDEDLSMPSGNFAISGGEDTLQAFALSNRNGLYAGHLVSLDHAYCQLLVCNSVMAGPPRSSPQEFVLPPPAPLEQCALFTKKAAALAALHKLKYPGSEEAFAAALDALLAPCISYNDSTGVVTVTLGRGTVDSNQPDNVFEPNGSDDPAEVLYATNIFVVSGNDIIAMAEFSPNGGAPSLSFPVVRGAALLTAYAYYNREGLYTSEDFIVGTIPASAPAQIACELSACYAMDDVALSDCIFPDVLAAEGIRRMVDDYGVTDGFVETSELYIVSAGEGIERQATVRYEAKDPVSVNDTAHLEVFDFGYVLLVSDDGTLETVAASATFAPDQVGTGGAEKVFDFVMPDYDANFTLIPHVMHSRRGLLRGTPFAVSPTAFFCPTRARGCPPVMSSEPVESSCFLQVRAAAIMEKGQRLPKSANLEVFAIAEQDPPGEFTAVVTPKFFSDLLSMNGNSPDFFIQTIFIMSNGVVLAMREFSHDDSTDTGILFLEFFLSVKSTVTLSAFVIPLGLFEYTREITPTGPAIVPNLCRLQGCFDVPDSSADEFPQCHLPEYLVETTTLLQNALYGSPEPRGVDDDPSRTPYIVFLNRTTAVVTVGRGSYTGEDVDGVMQPVISADVATVDYVEMIYVKDGDGNVVAETRFYPSPSAGSDPVVQSLVFAIPGQAWSLQAFALTSRDGLFAGANVTISSATSCDLLQCAGDAAGPPDASSQLPGGPTTFYCVEFEAKRAALYQRHQNEFPTRTSLTDFRSSARLTLDASGNATVTLDPSFFTDVASAGSHITAMYVTDTTTGNVLTFAEFSPTTELSPSLTFDIPVGTSAMQPFFFVNTGGLFHSGPPVDSNGHHAHAWPECALPVCYNGSSTQHCMLPEEMRAEVQRRNIPLEAGSEASLVIEPMFEGFAGNTRFEAVVRLADPGIRKGPYTQQTQILSYIDTVYVEAVDGSDNVVSAIGTLSPTASVDSPILLTFTISRTVHGLPQVSFTAVATFVDGGTTKLLTSAPFAFDAEAACPDQVPVCPTGDVQRADCFLHSVASSFWHDHERFNGHADPFPPNASAESVMRTPLWTVYDNGTATASMQTDLLTNPTLDKDDLKYVSALFVTDGDSELLAVALHGPFQAAPVSITVTVGKLSTVTAYAFISGEGLYSSAPATIDGPSFPAVVPPPACQLESCFPYEASAFTSLPFPECYLSVFFVIDAFQRQGLLFEEEMNADRDPATRAMHTPHITVRNATTAEVTIGGVFGGNPAAQVHPTVASDDPDDVHFIELIFVLDDAERVVAFRRFFPGGGGDGDAQASLVFDIPSTTSSLQAFAYCNRHGLWAGEAMEFDPPECLLRSCNGVPSPGPRLPLSQPLVALPEPATPPPAAAARCLLLEAKAAAYGKHHEKEHDRESPYPPDHIANLTPKLVTFNHVNQVQAYVTVGDGYTGTRLSDALDDVWYVVSIFVRDQNERVVAMQDFSLTQEALPSLSFFPPRGTTQLQAFVLYNGQGLYASVPVDVTTPSTQASEDIDCKLIDCFAFTDTASCDLGRALKAEAIRRDNKQNGGWLTADDDLVVHINEGTFSAVVKLTNHDRELPELATIEDGTFGGFYDFVYVTATETGAPDKVEVIASGTLSPLDVGDVLLEFTFPDRPDTTLTAYTWHTTRGFFKGPATVVPAEAYQPGAFPGCGQFSAAIITPDEFCFLDAMAADARLQDQLLKAKGVTPDPDTLQEMTPVIQQAGVTGSFLVTLGSGADMFESIGYEYASLIYVVDAATNITLFMAPFTTYTQRASLEFELPVTDGVNLTAYVLYPLQGLYASAAEHFVVQNSLASDIYCQFSGCMPAYAPEGSEKELDALYFELRMAEEKDEVLFATEDKASEEEARKPYITIVRGTKGVATVGKRTLTGDPNDLAFGNVASKDESEVDYIESLFVTDVLTGDIISLMKFYPGSPLMDSLALLFDIPSETDGLKVQAYYNRMGMYENTVSITAPMCDLLVCNSEVVFPTQPLPPPAEPTPQPTPQPTPVPTNTPTPTETPPGDTCPLFAAKRTAHFRLHTLMNPSHPEAFDSTAEKTVVFAMVGERGGTLSVSKAGYTPVLSGLATEIDYVMALWVETGEGQVFIMADYLPEVEEIPVISFEVPLGAAAVRGYALFNRNGVYRTALIDTSNHQSDTTDFPCQLEACHSVAERLTPCVFPAAIRAEVERRQERLIGPPSTAFAGLSIARVSPHDIAARVVLDNNQPDLSGDEYGLSQDPSYYFETVYVERYGSGGEFLDVTAAATLAPGVPITDGVLLSFNLPAQDRATELVPFVWHSVMGKIDGKRMFLPVAPPFCPEWVTGCPAPSSADGDCFMTVRLASLKLEHQLLQAEPIFGIGIERKPFLVKVPEVADSYIVSIGEGTVNPAKPDLVFRATATDFATTIAVVDSRGDVVAMAEFSDLDEKPTFRFTTKAQITKAVVFFNLYGLVESDETYNFGNIDETWRCALSDCMPAERATRDCGRDVKHMISHAMDREERYFSAAPQLPADEVEEHTPVFEVWNTTTGEVTVGGRYPHPTVASRDPDFVHYIELMWVEWEDKGDIIAARSFFPGGGADGPAVPKLQFSIPPGAQLLRAFAYCNRHGLYSSSLVVAEPRCQPAQCNGVETPLYQVVSETSGPSSAPQTTSPVSSAPVTISPVSSSPETESPTTSAPDTEEAAAAAAAAALSLQKWRRAHGAAMALAWGGFVPLTIFVKQFGMFDCCCGSAFYLHVFFAGCVVFLNIFAIGVAVVHFDGTDESSENRLARLHTETGFPLFAALFFQVLLGVLTRLPQEKTTVASVIKFVHRLFGRLVALFAMFQVLTGARKLHYYDESAALFLGIVALLVFVAFLAATVFKIKQNRSKKDARAELGTNEIELPERERNEDDVDDVQ